MSYSKDGKLAAGQILKAAQFALSIKRANEAGKPYMVPASIANGERPYQWACFEALLDSEKFVEDETITDGIGIWIEPRPEVNVGLSVIQTKRQARRAKPGDRCGWNCTHQRVAQVVRQRISCWPSWMPPSPSRARR